MQWVRYQSLQNNHLKKRKESQLQAVLLQACTQLDVEGLQQYFNTCAPYKVRETLVRLGDFFDYLWKLHPEDWWVRQVRGKGGVQEQMTSMHFEVYAGSQPIPYAGFTLSYQYNFSGQLNDMFISHYYILSDALLMEN